MSVNLSSLIKLVKLRPEIYHRHYLSEEHHNTWKAKEAAWEDVSKRLGVEAHILKKKWRTLRDQFQRHYKKIQSSNGLKIEIHWPYFEKLLFLKDHCKSKDNDNNSVLKIRTEDDDTQTSQFDIDTEDGYVNEDNVKYRTFETKFEAVNEDDMNDMADERDCDDNFYVVTTTAEQNDNICEEKMPRICDSNMLDDRLKSTSPRSKRKSNDNSNNLQISIKRAKHLDESDDNGLDRQISECLESIKKKSENSMDHIDHFCNFIASMMRQWPQKRQCEAMNYFTNYVMENHVQFKQNKE